MASGDQAIQALREALRISPDNLPLRQHLAESLLGMGRPDEAELVFREALAIAPENSRLKTGLAQAFYQQGKNTHCLVLVEDVLKQPDAPAIAAMLHARMLLRAGELDEARAKYRRAVEADASLSDSELAERLGLSRAVGKDDEEEEEKTISTRPSRKTTTTGHEFGVIGPTILHQSISRSSGPPRPSRTWVEWRHSRRRSGSRSFIL